MIKRLVDALRGREGYAGMAAFRDGTLIFDDALGPGLADKGRRLFEEGECAFKGHAMAAVIRGFTVAAFRAGDVIIVCRLEGRFAIPALPGEEEAEYTTGQQAAHLLARDEARREAELLLRHLLGD